MANIWQGERVRLRAIEPEDWPSFRRDGVQFTEDARLYDDRVQAPNSEEQARTRMTQWAEATPESDDRTLAIIDMNNELVGSISAHHCERLAGTFEFSLGIFHEHRRHGYALRRFAFWSATTSRSCGIRRSTRPSTPSIILRCSCFSRWASLRKADVDVPATPLASSTTTSCSA